MLVESRLRPTTLPVFAELIVPDKDDDEFRVMETVLIESTITSPVRAVPVAMKVTRPPFEPVVPLVSASASRSALALFVTVTLLSEMVPVVFVTENIVAGLFCPEDALRLEQAVAVQEYASEPPVKVITPLLAVAEDPAEEKT